MKQVIVLKLQPSAEQIQALLLVTEAFNAAANFIAAVAFKTQIINKLTIQPLIYREIRERFGLSSQLAIRAISKAIEAYKRDRAIQPVFKSHGAITYDERILSYKGRTHVSLMALGGRVIIPLRFGQFQATRFDRIKGQADLVFRDGFFYLYATTDVPAPLPADTPGGVLGVDFGIVEIATDSTGNSYSGKQVRSVRFRVKKHRRHLQHRQTNSAKKRLRCTSRRQSRFVRDSNHHISKQIVQTAFASLKAIALECLKGIRERAAVLGREMRWLLGNWAFDQLKQFIAYKAQRLGVPLIDVDPRDTSRTCSSCGFCDKANRKSQAHFCCLSCGFECNADANAAVNIEARGTQVFASQNTESIALLSSVYTPA